MAEFIDHVDESSPTAEGCVFNITGACSVQTPVTFR